MNKKMNLVIWVLAIILVILAASVFYAKYKPSNEAKQQDVKTTQTDDADKSSRKEMAPDFTLKDLNGKSVKLSDYRGKIVILNFWGVWCQYCKIESQT
jgi:cytochrome c biogenesis protein CcmG/thiol:disulfide interchange protein DsbE